MIGPVRREHAPDYGVVVGQYVSYTTNQGQWMHVDLNINAANLQYQAAVDVNEPNGLFQYQVFNNLDLSLFARLGERMPLLPARVKTFFCRKSEDEVVARRGHDCAVSVLNVSMDHGVCFN
jgi:hypothetical protein